MRQLWKKTIAVTLMVSLILTIYGCGKRTDVRKYSSSFFDCFDTVITVYGYSSDQASFNQMVALVHENFLELHEKFDAYHEYEDVVNVYTLNQNAGGDPIAVSVELYELIKQSKHLYGQTGGKVNVAMGSVLRLWHDARNDGVGDIATHQGCAPDNARNYGDKERGGGYYG